MPTAGQPIKATDVIRRTPVDSLSAADTYIQDSPFTMYSYSGYNNLYYPNQLIINSDTTNFSMVGKYGLGSSSTTNLDYSNLPYSKTLISSNQSTCTLYGTLSSSSSKRIKKNIQILSTNYSDKLLKLQPVLFMYKYDTQQHSGLIYEHTVQYIPEICNKQHAHKGIKYLELIPLLVLGIQYLYKKIEKE